MNKLIIGSHVSFKSEDQLLGSIKEALSYGANTFMFYTGAPQNTKRVPIKDYITIEAMQLMKDNNIDLRNIIVHAPYIINPANTANIEFAISFLRQEIERVEQLGITKLVLHPGSHVNLGEDIAIKNIITVLNSCILSDTKVDICLETMAGKGSEVGTNFGQLKRIIDGVLYNDKVKVCLDTCHLNDAGYDISDFDKLLDEFDKIIGINKIACIHINDSKNEIGTHKDRHENIGLGTIGFDNLIKVIHSKRLENVPKILETPYVTDSDDSNNKTFPPYKFEIEMIYNKKMNNNLIKDIRNYYK
ncbi:MAG TPA: deoxyribonuclease IV [Bacilli bacterium]|nr:deoxyribonuclease IV [Bacilli bacterium]